MIYAKDDEVKAIRVKWVLATACLFAYPCHAQNSGPVPFLKQTLTPQFYSEGINFGDLNRDGIQDIVSGPYWYPGPNYTQKLVFRTPRPTPFDTTGDSDCYSVFIFDFNQDGWPDILSLRLPGGAEAVLYENPKGATSDWAEYVVFSAADNESAVLLDIDKDGRPELITNSNGYGGWAQPDWSNPHKPWAFHPVTAKQTWGKFTHAIGASDVNGDGRSDLIFSNGWWEQPKVAIDTPWVQHAGAFGGQANPLEAFGGSQIYTYDVDGDGDSDIVTSQQAHGWGLAWYENQNLGKTFVQHLIMGTKDEESIYGAAFAQLHALAIADLDGDGLVDIITGKRKGAHGNGLGAELNTQGVLYWFKLTRPAGQLAHFLPYLIDSVAGIGTQLIAADINGDRSPDILTSRRAGSFAFLNQKTFPAGLDFPRPGRKLSGSGTIRARSFWLFPGWNLLGQTRRYWPF